MTQKKITALLLLLTVTTLLWTTLPADANNIYTQGELTYSSRNMGTHTLPHRISESPGAGLDLWMSYPTNVVDISAGVEGTYTYHENNMPNQNNITGHTTIFAAAHKKVGWAHFRLGQSYIHTRVRDPHSAYTTRAMQTPHSNDIWETLLKMRIGNSKEYKPYLFTGLELPGNMSLNEAIVFGGLGYDHREWMVKKLAALNTSTKIAFPIHSVDRTKNAVIKNRIEMMIHPGADFEIGVGFNLLTHLSEKGSQKTPKNVRINMRGVDLTDDRKNHWWWDLRINRPF